MRNLPIPWVVDPDKWSFDPFDSTVLIYRHPNLARAMHTQDAAYLDVVHAEAPSAWNRSDYAYHLTRRGVSHLACTAARPAGRRSMQPSRRPRRESEATRSSVTPTK